MLDTPNDRAMAIQQMQATDGWKLIESEARDTKAALVEKMLYLSPSSDEMFQCQAQARAMNFLLGFPESILETAKQVQEADADAKAQLDQEAQS